MLDGFTDFDIKNQVFKTSVYFGFLIGTPIILLWNLFLTKTKIGKIIGTLYSTIFLVLILLIHPIKILFSSGAWRTQTILYENEYSSFKTIEFQMQDVGAFGYNKRTVEVFRLTPLFIVTSNVPNNIDKRTDWVKVDKYVNELGLIEP